MSKSIYAINEAADLFEEARTILEKEYGPLVLITLIPWESIAILQEPMMQWEDKD